MTNYYHKMGNRVYKMALLQLITDTMWDKAVSFVHTDEGYDYEKDMIHFSSDGHKCILLGVGCPKVEEGIIPLRVRTEWDGEQDISVDVNLEMQFLHIKTLEKIACEVYTLLYDLEEDPDWEDIKKDYVSAFLDTDFYPEMKCMKKYKAQRSFD